MLVMINTRSCNSDDDKYMVVCNSEYTPLSPRTSSKGAFDAAAREIKWENFDEGVLFRLPWAESGKASS